MIKSVINKLIKNIILFSVILLIAIVCGFLILIVQREVSRGEEKLVELKQTSYLNDSKNLEYIKTLKLVSHKEKLKKLSEEKRRVKKSYVVSRSKSQGEQKKMIVEATAYLPDCEGCIGITKSGYNVKNTPYYKGMRVAACDVNVMPMYTVFVSDQLKDKMICLDTGGDIKSARIDILTHSEDWAWDWGRRTIEITILREGKG
jgi:3D (Asp-Asp-Asp) domain-containing protein